MRFALVILLAGVLVASAVPQGDYLPPSIILVQSSVISPAKRFAARKTTVLEPARDFVNSVIVDRETGGAERYSHFGIRANAVLVEIRRVGMTDELRAKLAALRIEIERAGQQIPLNALEGSQ